jgi:hypothetical protein
VVFLSPPGECRESALKLGHDRFLPNSYQFTTIPLTPTIYNLVTEEHRSRVRSGSIVSDYGLDDRTIGVRFPVGAKDFSCSLCVQTGSGAHPASCPMGTGGPFRGGKSAAGA